MSNMSYEELSTFLRFDETTLGMKLGQHAVLNHEVADNTLKAYNMVADLDLLIKELDNQLRLQARELGLKTEKAVEEKVESDETLKQLRRDRKNADLQHVRWTNLRYDYQTMQKNMDNTSKLIISGFLAY